MNTKLLIVAVLLWFSSTAHLWADTSSSQTQLQIVSVTGATSTGDNNYVVLVPDSGQSVTVTVQGNGSVTLDESERCKCGSQVKDPTPCGGLVYEFDLPASASPTDGTVTWTVDSNTTPQKYTFQLKRVTQYYQACDQGWSGGVTEKSNENASDIITIEVAKLEIESKTVATIPADQTRHKLGVGEQVVLTLKPSGLGSATWSSEVDGDLNSTSGETVTYTASDQASTGCIIANYGGSSCTVNFTVVEPTLETAEKVDDYVMPYAPGVQGVAMELKITVNPTDVSFQWIETQEISGPASNLTGIFKDATTSNLSHMSNGWMPVFPGNIHRDNCSFSITIVDVVKPVKYTIGGFDWVIPMQWRVRDKDHVGSLPDRVQKNNIISDDGTSTISKLGQNARRTP